VSCLLFAAFFLVCFFLVILIFIWRSKRRSLFQLFGLTISGPLCPFSAKSSRLDNPFGRNRRGSRWSLRRHDPLFLAQLKSRRRTLGARKNAELSAQTHFCNLGSHPVFCHLRRHQNWHGDTGQDGADGVTQDELGPCRSPRDIFRSLRRERDICQIVEMN
jgi:hypothetical protein